MIENIYILSIFTGVIIILVSLYFKKLANKASKATLEIIELNEKLKYDPYKFINEVFRHLKKIKIEDYSYEVVFGPKFERKKLLKKQVYQNLLSVTITVFTLRLFLKNLNGKEGIFT